jgi:pilus assembly protein Flp/PilA
MGKTAIRLRFPDGADRTRFLDAHFPVREVCPTPGLYRVRQWGMLGVVADHVTLYPYDRTVRQSRKPTSPATQRKENPMLKRLWTDEDGQDLTEYALLLVMLALAAVAALNTLATGLNGAFSQVAANMTSHTT